MTLQIATHSPVQPQEIPSSIPQLNQLVSLLVPALVEALLPSLSRSVGINTAESVTVSDFATSVGISERLVWQWLEDGILLPAPTKDASKIRASKKSGVSRSRTLINMTAWRAKQHQQAKDCKYIR
ncbi:hypothetical protein M2403_004522 [Rahnella sp. BIGb0603]|uniref:Cro/Cl family transcriptional regulator n=1 Tax=Rahnella sp. BIGb0603 TaxID=2940612 RepID=UPI00216755A0|nr:Cro/Cl family transcriptional regulator [Rahnella sp. BIGb0603]MCS3425889.1 hypothetical protein [Rahnella sp. BIGb0603]